MAELGDSTSANPDRLDRDQFDVVLCGTSFEHCMLAGALACAGKSVLHVDQHDYYGDDSATLSWPQLAQALGAYDDVTIIGGDRLNSRYLIDLQPGLLFARSELVDDMIRSGTHHYVTFRAINSHFTMIDSRIVPVPISRPAIFQCSYLSRPDKRRLMKLMHLVLNDDRLGEAPSNAADLQLLESYQDRPLGAYLDQLQLSAIAKDIILYSLCLADSPDVSTSSGMKTLRKFVNSLGRFDLGALLYPVYGMGDFPQAFARFAAVYGSTYLLRTRASIQERDGSVLLSTSQRISCDIFFGPDESKSGHGADENRSKLSRCICVCDKPIQNTDPLSLIVIPPNGMFRNPIKILQVDEGTGCVPKGSFIMYYSALQVKGPKADLSHTLDMLMPEENRLATIFFTESQRPHSDLAADSPRRIDLGHSSFNLDPDSRVERVRSLFTTLCPDAVFLQRDDDEGAAIDLDKIHNPEFDNILSNTADLSI